MSDNADLLGADALVGTTPAPRGRPRKPLSVETHTTPAGATIHVTAAPQPELNAEAFLRPEAGAADPHAYELAPVSTEYAAAARDRAFIIGQTNRDYAYKRLLRAGKKL